MKKCGCCGEKITGKHYKDEAGKLFHQTCVKAKSIVVAKETKDAKKIKPSKLPPGLEDAILRNNTIGEIDVKKNNSIGA